jgi:hypothetical protein
VRHLGSIILSLILVPIIYVLYGLGVGELGEANVSMTTDTVNYGHAGLAVLAFGAAGLLYALLVQTRISPLGPFLASLGFFGVGVWAIVDFKSLADTLPAHTFGIPEVLYYPLFGLTIFAAVPLLVTVISPRRWRRYANPAAATPAAMPPPVGYQPPAYPQSSAYSPAAPNYPAPSGAPNYPAPVSAAPAYPTNPAYPGPYIPPVPAGPGPASPVSASPVSGGPSSAPPASPDQETTRKISYPGGYQPATSPEDPDTDATRPL